MNAPPLGSRLSGGILGQSAQTSVPGVKIDVSHMRGTTRFNDLHDELQKHIEQVDAFIQQQISYAAQCSALLPAHAQNLAHIPTDAEYLGNRADTVELALDNDSGVVAKLKELLDEDVEDARRVFRVVENLKLPQQFHYPGLSWGHTSVAAAAGRTGVADGDDESASTDLVSYISSQADTFAKTLDDYRRNISEIEQHLRIVEATGMSQAELLMVKKVATDGKEGRSRGREEDLRSLAAVLGDFERGILGLASKVGAAREAVVELTVGVGGGQANGRLGNGRIGLGR